MYPPHPPPPFLHSDHTAQVTTGSTPLNILSSDDEVDDATERRQQVSPQEEPVFYRGSDTGEPVRRFGGMKTFLDVQFRATTDGTDRFMCSAGRTK